MTNRRKPRSNRRGSDDDGFVPLLPRIDVPVVRRDADRQLAPERLDDLCRLHGLEPSVRWRRLEATIGGLSFGEGYRCVRLGLACAFRAYLQRGAPGEPHRARDGQRLIEVGVEGDTHYYLSLVGEAWAQDHIADRWPHREASSLAELAARLRWPIVDELTALPAD